MQDLIKGFIKLRLDKPITEHKAPVRAALYCLSIIISTLQVLSNLPRRDYVGIKPLTYKSLH